MEPRFPTSVTPSRAISQRGAGPESRDSKGNLWIGFGSCRYTAVLSHPAWKSALPDQSGQLGLGSASLGGWQAHLENTPPAGTDRLDHRARTLKHGYLPGSPTHPPSLPVAEAKRHLSGPAYQIPIPEARPPHALIEGIPADCEVRILEAGAGAGWGTAPFGSEVPEPPIQLLAANPTAEFRGGIEALDSALAWLARHAGEPRSNALLIGSLSYALGAEFEPRAPRARDFETQSSVDLAAYRAHYRYSPGDRTGCVMGTCREDVRSLGELIGRAAGRGLQRRQCTRTRPVRSWLDAAAYRERVQTIRDWIRAGDVYQVNLARRLDVPGVTRAQTRELYARLAESAGAPFGAYLESSERIVLSNSPERYLRVLGRQVETCPIKGTRPRGSSPATDTRLAGDLQASAKDFAEHLMIVDLERNDLGRVCELGSVQVAELAALRGYPTVWHLVSSVQGKLRADVDLRKLLAASFPGGSITGAPKLRAMQIIEDLEPSGRDVYTGAVGYVDSQGDSDWSIAIRTAVLREKSLRLYVGAGIVADSDADREWQETRDKARAFRETWGLRT